MVDMIPGLSSIDWAGIIGPTFYWLGIILGSLLLMMVFFVIVHIISYPYKMTIFPLYGGVENETFSIGKRKTNRVKWNKTKTSWKKLFPLGNKEELQPFKENYVYAGKQIYAFQIGNELMPCSLEINKSEKNAVGQINPVPHHIRNWQSLAHKKNAIEFAEHNWWEDNKQYIIMLGVVLFCCALAGTTIYFTYKFTAGQFSGGVGAMNNLAESLKNFNPGGVGPS